MKAPRARRAVGATATGAVALLLWLLFLPVPPALVRSLVLANGSWLVTDYLAEPGVGRFEAARDKLLAVYLQHHLVREVATRTPAPAGSSDVERILAVLRRLRPLLVPASQLPQPVAEWQGMIVGLGYCDQVNGVAAEALAHHFPRSETFALRDPHTGVSPHTLGRVWSEERGGWLYWDFFYDALEVYEIAGGAASVLARERVPGGSPDPGGAGGEARYERTVHGRTLNEYHATFGAYLAFKVRQTLGGRRAPTLAAAPDRLRASAAAAPSGASRRQGPPPDRLARMYLEARVEHLLGSSDEAARRYAAVAALPDDGADPTGTLLRRAASVLRHNARPGPPPR